MNNEKAKGRLDGTGRMNARASRAVLCSRYSLPCGGREGRPQASLVRPRSSILGSFTGCSGGGGLLWWQWQLASPAHGHSTPAGGGLLWWQWQLASPAHGHSMSAGGGGLLWWQGLHKGRRGWSPVSRRLVARTSSWRQCWEAEHAVAGLHRASGRASPVSSHHAAAGHVLRHGLATHHPAHHRPSARPALLRLGAAAHHALHPRAGAPPHARAGPAVWR